MEEYRRAAERVLGRRIAAVEAPDAWFLKAGLDAPTVQAALVGRRFVAARRRGKLLLLDTDTDTDTDTGTGGGTGTGGDMDADGGGSDRDGPTLGLRFGMTGRLLVDGSAPIERLEYGSAREVPQWDRFGVRFDGGGRLVMRDPRRLGGVLLEPDEDRLGPDAAVVTAAGLRAALAGSAAPLKARLMDQSRLAGLGNLLTDEALWRAGLDPARPAGSLSAAELRRLHRHLRETLAVLGARGGSHTGDLHVSRVRGGRCPRDGAALDRRTVGGRTTYSCPRHQR
ncbi:MAG: formamidopyrimidine-DNA glycosylase [Actinobacteria bacterium]|nr:formamidopyrimidine-DNA glycosylase [Actinomycetota bacterium]